MEKDDDQQPDDFLGAIKPARGAVNDHPEPKKGCEQREKTSPKMPRPARKPKALEDSTPARLLVAPPCYVQTSSRSVRVTRAIQMGKTPAAGGRLQQMESVPILISLRGSVDQPRQE